MIRYADGSEPRVGDRVDYDGEPSVVEQVVELNDVIVKSGTVDGPGLMLTNESFGRVFVGATDSPSWDSITFLGRGD